MRIENNYEYNSIELYFDGKPDEITRETLKMFKWRWNPKKLCWYNRNTAENMALAESLNSSVDEMQEKKIPDSYAKKYYKEESKDSTPVSNLDDSIVKENSVQENNTFKESEHMKKKHNLLKKNIIDIEDDNFELNL